jgi:predicted DsbA family dithiol-disulfide isomerase
MASVQKNVTLHILGDILCPYSFIGKRHVEAALKQLSDEAPQVKVDVTWMPFLLARNLTKSGVSKQTYYQDRFKKEPQEVLKRPGVLAQFCDPPIVFSNEGTVGSSFDAHRLSLWARQCGGQEGQLGLMEYFFRSHWTDGLNIGDNAVLLDSVSRAGLDVGAAETVLESSEYGEEVERQSRGRLTTACGGVPCFLFGGETTLSGPVPTGDIVREIKACLEEKNDPFAQ